jgi:hypothetical protein
MKEPKQWQVPTGFKYPIMLAAVGFLALVLEASAVKAAEEEDKSVPFNAAAAALLLQNGGIHNMAGQVIRCQPSETVGIWVNSVSDVVLTDLIVEGCAIGIAVTGSAKPDPSTNLSGGLGLQRSSIHVERVGIRDTTIGFFLAGNGGLVSNNIAGGAGYGFVVTGDDYIITGNESNDNTGDGFLVTGDRNILEGNEARRNGGVGIHVARMVPMVQTIKRPRLLPDVQHFFFRDKRVLRFIQDQGLGNVIRGNTALENELDLAEFAECASPPDAPLENKWANNTFETRRPDCIR